MLLVPKGVSGFYYIEMTVFGVLEGGGERGREGGREGERGICIMYEV